LGSIAEELMAEFVIKDLADIERVRQQATADANDEMQGGIESVAFTLERGLISLPVTLQLPPPPAPDAIVHSHGKPLFGVEVTRVGWETLTQVRNVAAGMGDRIVEIGTGLLADRKAERDKNSPKGSRSGDWAAIREPSEKMIGDGMTGEDAWAAMLSALRAAIGRKKPKLDGYKGATDEIWLLLIADGLIANWEDILTRPDLTHVKDEVSEACADSGFDRVLLLRDTQMMPSNVTVLFSKN
jgi:hypothetical protein